jgi:hypothetical protein
MTVIDSSRPSDAPFRAPTSSDAGAVSIAQQQLRDYQASSSPQLRKDGGGQLAGLLDLNADIYGLGTPTFAPKDATATAPKDATTPTAGSQQAEATSFLGRLEQWGTSTMKSAEEAGRSALTSAENSYVGHKLTDAASVASTVAGGVAESLGETVKGLGNVPSVIGHAAAAAGSWAYDHPLETAGIVAGVAAAATLEVMTGGMATAALVAVAPALLEIGATTAAANTLVTAGEKVINHNDVGTLMNQENHTPAEVAAAQKRLQEDTGGAIVTGALALTGAGIARRAASEVAGGTEAGTATKTAAAAGTDAATTVTKDAVAAGTDTAATVVKGAEATSEAVGTASNAETASIATTGPVSGVETAGNVETATVATVEETKPVGILTQAQKIADSAHSAGETGATFAPVAEGADQQVDIRNRKYTGN